MRPVRLELHGFTAFREPAVVDFAGADLFALAGPTGAGKSSVIDGMCFALYGSVPRLDRRTVAPVISTGKVEARIRFDFTVGDRTYTAARVVRRTGTGATTKEARLEHEGTVLAGDADGVTDAVERLLGLGFEQFTKSVVLPQGDFARFLHDKPSARQELLVKLLELDVYERMRSAANTRKVAAEASADVIGRRLDELADATPEAVAAAVDRVERLTQLRGEIDDAQPQIDQLARTRDEAAAAEKTAIEATARLTAVAVPDGVEALAEAAAAADQAAGAADRVLRAAEARVAETEKARADIGDAATLQRQRAAHEQRRTLSERIARGRTVVEKERSDEDRAGSAVEAATAAVAGAAAAVEAARRDHAAHDLAVDLVAGEPCPVCHQTVSDIPRRDTPPALSAAQRRHADAERSLKQATDALASTAQSRARADQLLETLTEQLADTERQLDGAPSADDVAAALDAITTADATLAAAREAERSARADARQATDAAEQARRRRDSAWAAFDAARDAVAALAPPAADRDDLVAAWSSLADWAKHERGRQSDAAAAARRQAQTAAEELGAVQAKIATRCDECEVVVTDGTRARDAVADAVARAEAGRDRLAAAVEQAERLRTELKALEGRIAVAKTLGNHLSARGFEQWLLDEALDSLAAGATAVLRELSAGQYSLALDGQRNFLVVDHRSADEQRPARTLSGGETFLASLSLALSLGEHLASMSVGAQPRLESIFLDEGFGTLDPETLDVVAAAIEELGARGRTVGIVTHVRDLAERMPVRFEVRKQPGGSTVERAEL